MSFRSVEEHLNNIEHKVDEIERRTRNKGHSAIIVILLMIIYNVILTRTDVQQILDIIVNSTK